MKKFLTAIVAAMFLLMSHADAEVQTYTGTGEYRMGDSDTPKSAERGAKEKALRDALERAGVYVGSYSEVEDAELVTDKIISRTGAVLKVLDTKVVWDGFIVRVTVQVEIDADEINRRLKNIDTPEKNSSPPAADNIALSKAKSDEAERLGNYGSYYEAISLAKEAIELNPNNSKAYIVMGFVYNKLEEYQKSLPFCNKALELEPNHKWAYSTRGWAHKGLKKYHQAIADFNKAIEINPNHKWAYVGRAYTYEALGEHAKARADFAKARQLGWKG